MIKKEKGRPCLADSKLGYRVVHAAEINENIATIRDHYLSRVNTDKIMKQVNYGAYEKLLAALKDVTMAHDKLYDLKGILQFQQEMARTMATLEAFPRKLHKLERAGYSISSMAPHEFVMHLNVIQENIYMLHYVMPQLEDYLVCGPEIRALRGAALVAFEKFLIKHALYDMIVLFRMESVAASLRASMAVVPLLGGSDAISKWIQRFGMIPASNFKPYHPGPHDVVINIDGTYGQHQTYYDSFNIYKGDRSIAGLSMTAVRNEINPMDIVPMTKAPTSKIKAPTPKSAIYETMDGVNYRKLKCTPENMARLHRGPSAMANGYNQQINEAIAKHIHAPILSERILEVTKTEGKQKYSDIRSNIRKLPRDQIIDAFLEAVINELDFDREAKTLQAELRITLDAERIRLTQKLAATPTVEEFFKEVIADKSNFILTFNRKIKIYNFKSNFNKAKNN